jgi:hypothetical protein
VTEWQRDMARTLVRMFNETVPFTPDPDVPRRKTETRQFEVASAMCHLLDDIAEGRDRKRSFYNIDARSAADEVQP